MEPPHGWLCELSRDFTRRKIQYLRFDQLQALKYPLFLKPPDDKLFGAAVYDSPAELLKREDIDPAQGILASDPMTFLREYRVYMLDHRAVARSLYSVGGEYVEDSSDGNLEAASDFAALVAAGCTDQTPSAVVIDVGLTAAGEWAVVEANPVFGAGIYQADPGRVLDVLSAACCHPEVAPERFSYPVELE